MVFKLTLEFATDEDRMSFIGWFLDGGGDQGFNEARDIGGETHLSAEPPEGKDWEWPEDLVWPEPLDNYTIRMVDEP